MSKLELKIVPPVIFLVFTLAMWAISLITPQTEVLDSHGIIIPALFVAAGVSLMLVSALAFSKAKTTMDPREPEKTSALLTGGSYRFSRNPLYVANLLILLGWGFYLSNLYALILIVGFVLYINRFQIIPEERALQTRFGDQFLAYKAKVRRWI